MMGRYSPFLLMNMMFSGFGISLIYGLLSALTLYFANGYDESQAFLHVYTSSFRTLISLGLILGTAIIINQTQDIVPGIIENVFRGKQLEKTSYYHYKHLYFNRRRSIIYSSEFGLASFLIFLLCKFPLPLFAENLMILAACSEYAFGVYVGRKIFYAGLMVNSLLDVKITRNIFRKHELDGINSYINVASTLTIIFGFVHLNNYLSGPFTFDGAIGVGAKTLLIVPMIIGTPVLLIFNFYPRVVLKKVYSESIDVEIRNLKRRLKNRSLSHFEQLSYIIEFNRQARDELRYRLRLTLTDLPIGLAIMLMAGQILLGR